MLVAKNSVYVKIREETKAIMKSFWIFDLGVLFSQIMVKVISKSTKTVSAGVVVVYLLLTLNKYVPNA